MSVHKRVWLQDATLFVYTVKKFIVFPVPTRDVTNQTLPGRESVVSDIPAGDGKTANLFLQCIFHIL